jgi:hypothetical protein
VDLIASESMEAFLYRSTALLSQSMEISSPAKAPDQPKSEKNEPFWQSMGLDMCGLTGSTFDEVPSPPRTPFKSPLGMVNCASQALGDSQSFDVEDSFVEAATFEQQNTPLAIHSELLEAEKELVWSWRTRALIAMEKLRVLTEQEKHIGASWKRFAISVSNLFAYEKDVESARLGDSKSRPQMPYRKLQKSAVDECLRILARQKNERCSPALEALNPMMSAYVADLSAVHPSVHAYLEGVKQISAARKRQAAGKARHAPKQSTLTNQLKAGILEVKKQIAGVKVDGDSSATVTSKMIEEEHLQQLHHLKTAEQRVLNNESLLRESLTTMCKTTPVRAARMAYRYFNIEARQCATLHAAAVTMRNKIAVASKESLSTMINRQHIETKEDLASELQLVQRIVNIGNTKRFLKEDDDGVTTEVERGVELGTDIQDDEARSKLRDNAMQLCRKRIGRWDAKLAMSIMEAVGVDDANVRVEETTRDLRMVRKYAIGLRENVQRCIDALDMLRVSILQGALGDIRDVRHEFIAEMQTLFSAAYLPSEKSNTIASTQSIALLQNEGITLDDPSGWQQQKPGSCGKAVAVYMDARESGTEWLMDSLGALLKEYNERVESVENFVYMECVGIQLEKHFSQSRATALTGMFDVILLWSCSD